VKNVWGGECLGLNLKRIRFFSRVIGLGGPAVRGKTGSGSLIGLQPTKGTEVI
jgi:hypothetical protein